jgi:cell division protein FtsB
MRATKKSRKSNTRKSNTRSNIWAVLWQQERVFMFLWASLFVFGVYVLGHSLWMWQRISVAQARLGEIQQQAQDKRNDNQQITERIRVLSSPEGQEQWARKNNFSRPEEVVYFLQPTQTPIGATQAPIRAQRLP